MNSQSQNTVSREAWVPTAELDTFKSRVVILNKKAAKLGCSPIEFNICPETRIIKVPSEQIGGPTGPVIPGFDYRETKVEITGKTPILNGYVVAGKLDHDPRMGANIVLELNNITLPEKYRETDCSCEHCNTNRVRTKTYILKNIQTGEFKQVGGSCLKDFTGHDDPEWACKVNIYVKEALDELGEPISKGSLDAYVPVKEYLGFVSEAIIREGYLSATKAEEQLRMCTADAAYGVYLKRHEESMKQYLPTPKALDIVDKVIEFVESKEEQGSNYINNLKTIFNAQIFKEKYIRLVGSSIAYYQNELSKNIFAVDKSAKKHIGLKGEKVNFCGTVSKMNTYDTQFGRMRMYIMNDSEGNSVVWKSSTQAEIEIGREYDISATVKEHSTYNDMPQTEIVRPKFSIKQELFTEEVCKRIADDAMIFGSLKGVEVVDFICKNNNNAFQDNMLKNYAGISNISVYLNDAPQSKNGKIINSMDASEILKLSKAIMDAGYHNDWSVVNTNRFIKNNSDLFNKISKTKQKTSKSAAL